jgi:hypothetical protein
MIDQARKFSNKGFQVTRRVIAIAAVAAIIVWPKIVPVFWPDISVWVSWTEVTNGFLFFTDPKSQVVWRELGGLVITPLDTQLLAAIVGMFFGNQISK